MTDLDRRLAESKQRFTDAVTQALSGADAGWHRRAIECAPVNRLLSEIRMQRPKPAGVWAEAARIRGKG